ncbi:MAG: DUF1570 domain-containing protein [Planctomycetes bacterium]|nr:DUF1570 domain-containing protein [Planctomycetota bacterium]MBI3835407.1 DUF1570 domain-containing protein [Planctomycetota bacterium]
MRFGILLNFAYMIWLPLTAGDDPSSVMGSHGWVRSTAHFEIVNDVAECDLRPLVARLEGTYNAIQRFAKAEGFGVASDPANQQTPLDPPLVRGEAAQRPKWGEARLPLKIILFNSQADFGKQLATFHIGANSVAGFYDQATNMAVFCNARDHDDVRRINGEIASLQEKFRAVAGLGAGDDGDVQSDAIENAINALRQQREDVIESYNRFTIQHEAAHQVLFNLGVHAFGTGNPPWLVEGLATQFEVPQANRQGNLNNVNQYRLTDFREAVGAVARNERISDAEIDALFRDERLISFDSLLTDRLFNRNDGAVNLRYAESWALVYFLAHEHSKGFHEYLQKVVTAAKDDGPGAGTSSKRDLDSFRASFGPIDEALQRRFVRFILKLPVRN